MWIKLHQGETKVSGGIDCSLINQQNGNVVPNWIDPSASAASQTLSVLFQRERFLAGGTDQDIEQIFGNHEFYFIQHLGTKGAERLPSAMAQLTFTVRHE
jgi:hypothetical protein